MTFFCILKLLTWAMRSSETDNFFRKTGVEKVFAHTPKNSAISPNSLVCKFCGKAQFPLSFYDSPETMKKLRLSTKFQHQEVRWDYGILHIATCTSCIQIFWIYQELTKGYSPVGGNRVLIL